MALLGAYLFFAPDISAIDEAPSMRNSRMVGVCIVGIIVWGLGINSRVTEWTKAALGCWLLLAPFALGYGGMAAWNARAVGVLILALVGVRSDPSALWAWLRTGTLHLRAHRITPNGIVGYRGSEVPPIPGGALSTDRGAFGPGLPYVAQRTVGGGGRDVRVGLQRLHGRSDHAEPPRQRRGTRIRPRTASEA